MKCWTVRRYNFERMLPVLILLVGDTHMDESSIWAANDLAKEEDVNCIIQVGDFGYTFDQTLLGRDFMYAVSAATVPWMFIRGNHDSTEWILRASGQDHLYGDVPIEVSSNLEWIPDGCFIDFDGVMFSFLGGAYSIDKDSRTPYISYWPDESPSVVHTDRIADILISHDLPQDKFENRLFQHLLPTIPRHHIDGSIAARKIVQYWCEQIKPKMIIHGHYHIHYQAEVLDCQQMGTMDQRMYLILKNINSRRQTNDSTKRIS